MGCAGIISASHASGVGGGDEAGASFVCGARAGGGIPLPEGTLQAGGAGRADGPRLCRSPGMRGVITPSTP
ncbi:hypothetical protein [Salana multivorans]|uniref:hypothetical protein n=1 Tax=Salana multivorans TaxID=120377 RepID=UPI003CD0D856